MSEPIALCFSGGKDSVLALAAIQRQARYEVVRLVGTRITSRQPTIKEGPHHDLSTPAFVPARGPARVNRRCLHIVSSRSLPAPPRS